MAAFALVGSPRRTRSRRGVPGRTTALLGSVVRFVFKTIAVLAIATVVVACVAPSVLLLLGYEPAILGEEIMGQAITLPMAAGAGGTVLVLSIGVIWGGTSIRNRRAAARYW
jgi:hypothetical protein